MNCELINYQGVVQNGVSRLVFVCGINIGEIATFSFYDWMQRPFLNQFGKTSGCFQ